MRYSSVDWSVPQRQSQKGILILALVKYGKILRNFWFVILYIIFNYKENSVLIISLLAISTLIFAIVQAFVKYKYFTFQLDYERNELIVNEGVFNKKTILLEKNKIQEVNINQPFLHRFLDIYQLEIDSPGTDKNEITINAILKSDADYLKNYLLDSRADIQLDSIEEVEKIDQLKISNFSLVKYALTANYIKSFLALISVLLYLSQQFFDNLNIDFEDYIRENESLKTVQALSIVTIVVLFILLAVFAIFINVVKTLVTYCNFKIRKFTDYLSVEYGLLNRKNHIISKTKVQITTVTQNYFQKLGDVLHLKFSQIGEENAKNNTINIVGCNLAEKKEIFELLYEDDPQYQHSIKPNFRYLISRLIIFIVIPIALGFLSPYHLEDLVLYSIIYIIFAGAIIFFSYRNSKLSFNEDYLQKQAGVWDIDQKTIFLKNIQAIEMSQYFWQKRSGLGNINLVTAGGNLSLKTADISKLKKLVNYCLFKVESSTKNWM